MPLSEKAMAPHSSTLAWKIPWVGKPGRLPSMGSHRVGHDWVPSLSLFTFTLWRRTWQPTPVFLPGESRGQGSLVGFRLWGHTALDTTEATKEQQLQSSSSSSSIFEIEKSQSSNFILFLNCFGYPGSLYFHKNVRSSSSISAKMLWLCWICRSICCHVNNTKFVIYQYMMPFHLFRSSLMSIENPSVLYYCSFFKILLASMINCFLTLLI